MDSRSVINGKLLNWKALVTVVNTPKPMEPLIKGRFQIYRSWWDAAHVTSESTKLRIWATTYPSVCTSMSIITFLYDFKISNNDYVQNVRIVELYMFCWTVGHTVMEVAVWTAASPVCTSFSILQLLMNIVSITVTTFCISSMLVIVLSAWGQGRVGQKSDVESFISLLIRKLRTCMVWVI